MMLAKKNYRFLAAHVASHLALPLMSSLVAGIGISVFSRHFIVGSIDVIGPALLKNYGNAYAVLSFAIPLAVGTLFLFVFNTPILRHVLDPEHGKPWPPRVLTRLLNAPLSYAIIIMTAWVISYLTNVTILVLKGAAIKPYIALISLIGTVLPGILGMTITYYSLDLINRIYFIPRVFPDSILSGCAGFLKMSIKQRFIMYFLSVSVLPVFCIFLMAFIVLNAEGPVRITTTVILAQIVAILTIAWFVTMLVWRTFEIPLKNLTSAAGEIRRGNFTVHVPVRTNDEIGLLGETFNNMSVRLKERVEMEERTRSLEMQRAIMLEDIRLASKIQHTLLPQSPPNVQNASVAYKYVPMLDIGGDLVDIIYRADQGQLGLFICDVSGHGVSAALTAGMIKMAMASWHETLGSPAETLERLRNSLVGKLGGNFVTASVACLDLARNRVLLARAGHPPFLLVRGDSRVEIITPRGHCISELSRINYEEVSYGMGPGDKIILYTDGIIEASRDSELFGTDRFIDFARSHRALDPELFCEEVYRHVIDFSGDVQLDDDLTILVADRR